MFRNFKYTFYLYDTYFECFLGMSSISSILRSSYNSRYLNISEVPPLKLVDDFTLLDNSNMAHIKIPGLCMDCPSASGYNDYLKYVAFCVKHNCYENIDSSVNIPIALQRVIWVPCRFEADQNWTKYFSPNWEESCSPDWWFDLLELDEYYV